MDEKYVKVKTKDHYDLNCIDSITKYVTAHLFVDKRSIENCKKFLSQIKTTCYEQIIETYKKERYKKVKDRELIVFVSDKLENYKNAFNKLFYRIAKLEFGIPIKLKKEGLKHNNNHIERYNGKIKDRIKVMRGGFRSFERAEAFMNLKHVIHNFVNPHQQLGEITPAEEARIDLKLKRNKLLRLIRYSARKII